MAPLGGSKPPAVAARGRWSQVRTARLDIDAALGEEGRWSMFQEEDTLALQADKVLTKALGEVLWEISNLVIHRA